MYCNKTTAGLHYSNRPISPEISKLHLITCLAAPQNIFLFWGRISLIERAVFGYHNAPTPAKGSKIILLILNGSYCKKLCWLQYEKVLTKLLILKLTS